ncbi:MAG: NBR1-Ig-like domain-containing protein [Anaerolineales bacterium]
MFRRNYRLFFLLVATLVMLACMPVLAATPAPIPTFDPNSINTSIVSTANAAITQTALFTTPTDTPTITPTFTVAPSDTPSPTATVLFLLATPTVASPVPTPGGSGKKFDCAVLSKTPADGTSVSPNVDFSVTWHVLNIGTDFWNSNDVDYHYSSGDKFHLQKAYDLEQSVSVGQETDLKVSMKSPGTAGTYSTTWKMQSGKTEFCALTFTIQVLGQ